MAFLIAIECVLATSKNVFDVCSIPLHPVVCVHKLAMGPWDAWELCSN